MASEEIRNASPETLKRIIERGTKDADEQIDLHQKLLREAKELLALNPDSPVYLKQKQDSERALMFNEVLKGAIHARVVMAKEQLAEIQGTAPPKDGLMTVQLVEAFRGECERTGWDLLKEGRYQETIEYCNEGLAKYPDSAYYAQ